MRGRVLSLLVLAIAGTTPIGAPLMGWLAEHVGTRATFVVAGALTAIAAALAYLYMRRTSVPARSRILPLIDPSLIDRSGADPCSRPI
jgi:predicted MFS family arabinose efflux permease